MVGVQLSISAATLFVQEEDSKDSKDSKDLHLSLFVNGDTLAKNAKNGHRRAEAGGWWSVCSDPCLISLWTRVARC